METKEAFRDVKVLDFAWIGFGPMITKYLSDHGATVIRIETRSRPDVLRLRAPYRDGVPGINRSGYFAFINPNKYSMGLNINHPEGLRIAKELVQWADVVTENFTPGTMEKWGLGYEDLKKIKPSIIMLRCSMQGHTGPYARHGGYGLQLTALTGVTSITGWPDRAPVQPYGAYTDWMGPPWGTAVLLAALLYRKKTGKGQCIKLSQLEIGLQFLAPLFLSYTVNGKVAGRAGNMSACAAPHGVYQCKGEDRYCAIAIFTEEEWQEFCKIMGSPEWTRETRFSSLKVRKENEEELNSLVEAWTVNFSPEEIMHRLQTAGIAAGVVQTGKELLDDPQLKHRGYFWVMNHSEIGPFSHLGESFILSKSPSRAYFPAPRFGEHTEKICREVLKMSDGEFVRLYNEGVIELP